MHPPHFEAAAPESCVLLVEDDSALRGTLAVCLRIAGFQVATAPDEDSALRQFEQRRPMAVISDLILPDGEGMNIVRRMRAAAPDAPIVVISGGGMFPATHLLGVAKSLGANAALSKPFKPAALVDVLRGLVQAA
jgi:DNA-binding response OmpR family regulator